MVQEVGMTRRAMTWTLCHVTATVRYVYKTLVTWNKTQKEKKTYLQPKRHHNRCLLEIRAVHHPFDGYGCKIDG